MNEFLQARFIENPDTNAQWIQILPAGIWNGNDGRGPYRLSDPDRVIANSYRPKTDLVIDRMS